MSIRPNMNMPTTLAEMGGDGKDGRPPFVRAPVWPPMVVQSTAPDVFAIYRAYSCGVAADDDDNVTDTAVEREIRFTLPVIGYALSGSVRISNGSGFPVGWKPLDCWDIKLSTQGGESITINARMGGNFIGSAGRPGFLGGAGWVWNVGTVAIFELTPRLALPDGVTMAIDITMHTVEFRQGASFLTGGR